MERIFSLTFCFVSFILYITKAKPNRKKKKDNKCSLRENEIFLLMNKLNNTSN